MLNTLDLAPVAGYLVRGGRCATCGVSIGLSSPAVEALCGAAMLGSVALLGPWRGGVVGFAAVTVIGAVAVSLGYAGMRRATPGSQQG